MSEIICIIVAALMGVACVVIVAMAVAQSWGDVEVNE